MIPLISIKFPFKSSLDNYWTLIIIIIPVCHVLSQVRHYSIRSYGKKIWQRNHNATHSPVTSKLNGLRQITSYHTFRCWWRWSPLEIPSIRLSLSRDAAAGDCGQGGAMQCSAICWDRMHVQYKMQWLLLLLRLSTVSARRVVYTAQLWSFVAESVYCPDHQSVRS